jgi:hypothetical protein
MSARPNWCSCQESVEKASRELPAPAIEEQDEVVTAQTATAS